MSGHSRLTKWLAAPSPIAHVPWSDLAIACVLSVLVVVSLATHPDRPNVLGELLGLTMTVPVAWRRVAPVQAAAGATAGAVLNGVLVSNHVRCIGALPAMLLITFSSAVRLDRAAALVVLALAVGDSAAQAAWDPAPGGISAVVPLSAFNLVVWGVGRLVRSRNAAELALRRRAAELREQREATAAMAVAADRERVAEGLNAFLEQQIGELAATAASGRDAATTGPAEARAALSAIEAGGRETLGQMREVVGTLRQDALASPQPTLDRLETLLGTATAADTRLRVEGKPRVLPAGVELSAYRIVEHLLIAMDDVPEATIDVELHFTEQALELSLAGPPAPRGNPAAVLAVVRERVALHGGTVRTRSSTGRLETVVRLPLVSARG